MNKYGRRAFIRIGSGVLAGFAIAPMACNSENRPANTGNDKAAPSNDDLSALTAFGIQLYTLRDLMPKDPKGVLKQVAEMGYKQVEGYEGDAGIYWGMSNKDFKSYLDGLGLDFVSSHCEFTKDFEKKAADAAEIGMKYLMCPWIGPQKSLDDYKRFAADFNRAGEVCRKNGLRFAYHNHDYSFKAIDGQLPQAVIMENTDPALVDFEMDIYWVVAAGEDPETWLNKYPNRFRACHVKDRSKTPVKDEGENSCDLGTGSIDFPKILKTASDNGMQYYIVEQEAYPNGSPIEAAKVDAGYMKKLRI